MTDRYINIDRLLRLMEQYGEPYITRGWLADWAENNCEDLPPLENTPPPTITAQWVLSSYATGETKKQYVCSNCRTPYRLLDEVVGTKYADLLYMLEGTQFCPSCGAKMIEGDGGQ